MESNHLQRRQILGKAGIAAAIVGAGARPLAASAAVERGRETSAGGARTEFSGYSLNSYSVRRDAGAIDDGVTDVTSRINKLYQRAARTGATVIWETTMGKGFVVSGPGVVVPQGARTVGLGCDIDRSNKTLHGAFLLPGNASTTALLTLGQPGTGASRTNPHGSSVEGLGFLGTTPEGANVPGLWGIRINDTADISVVDCVALNIDPVGSGGAFFWNSTFQTAPPRYSSENARVLRCQAYFCGTAVKGDGAGCTDGKVDVLQANMCNTSVSLGATAGGGGWDLGPGTHLSGTGNLAHLSVGPAARIVRCTGVYFDVAGGWQIDYLGRGLQCSNCFFLHGTVEAPPSGEARCPINLASTEPYSPDSSIVGCRFYVNPGTAAHFPAQGFVRLGTTGEPYSLMFEANTVTNQGYPAPPGWLGYVLNSAQWNAPPTVLAGSINGTRDFAAVNQTAW